MQITASRLNGAPHPVQKRFRESPVCSLAGMGDPQYGQNRASMGEVAPHDEHSGPVACRWAGGAGEGTVPVNEPEEAFKSGNRMAIVF